MTGASAEGWVALSAGVTFGSVSVAQLKAGAIPSGRQIASTCLAFATLGIVAGSAPDIGGGLAIAVGATAFVTYGLPTILEYFPNAKEAK